jgi:hypothetical protein
MTPSLSKLEKQLLSGAVLFFGLALGIPPGQIRLNAERRNGGRRVIPGWIRMHCFHYRMLLDGTKIHFPPEETNTVAAEYLYIRKKDNLFCRDKREYLNRRTNFLVWKRFPQIAATLPGPVKEEAIVSMKKERPLSYSGLSF